MLITCLLKNANLHGPRHIGNEKNICDKMMRDRKIFEFFYLASSRKMMNEMWYKCISIHPLHSFYQKNWMIITFFRLQIFSRKLAKITKMQYFHGAWKLEGVGPPILSEISHRFRNSMIRYSENQFQMLIWK